MAEHFPNTKYVFEASGYTIEQMALLTPDVLEKLKKAIAKTLIEKSRDVESIKQSSDKILYPAEYAIRANMLIEARRLVGGVVLEQN